MRWIDIDLPGPGINQEFDHLLAAAAVEHAALDYVQEREGLDNVAVTELLGLVGQKLFQAVMAVDPAAFHPESEGTTGTRVPPLGQADHDTLRGYHLVVPPPLLDRPWSWLHNGVEFLLAKHPLCVGGQGAAVPLDGPQRPWMQRYQRAGFLLGPAGEADLRNTLDQLRPTPDDLPRLLFIPGHSEDRIRRLIFREAETIENALARSGLGEPLARLEVPTAALTPAELVNQGVTYQGLHFAGPTSVPARMDDKLGHDWMQRLVEEMGSRSDREIEELAGLEGEILGVDPITALLDAVGEKAAGQRQECDSLPVGPEASRQLSQGRSGGGRSARNQTRNPWLLDDGPVPPESISQAGGVPPLVYSNNYRGLPELGARFLAAGASTFIGPLLPLFSRPARIFSGYFYAALADGWCVGAASWRAAQSCRRELGADHPAWLSYGVQGYGSLALQYL